MVKSKQDQIFIEIAIWGVDLFLCSAPKFAPHPWGSYGGQGHLLFYVGAKGRSWSQTVRKYCKIPFYPWTFYGGSTDIKTDAQYPKFNTDILVFPVFNIVIK
jgi:hypothetical protein